MMLVLVLKARCGPSAAIKMIHAGGQIKRLVVPTAGLISREEDEGSSNRRRVHPIVTSKVVVGKKLMAFSPKSPPSNQCPE